jgi:hypothetical protein
MTVIVLIDNREALPVRAIPFVTGWKMPPDQVAWSLAHKDPAQKLEGITAKRRLATGEVREVLPKAWDRVVAEIEALTATLQENGLHPPRNRPTWERESLRCLPAECFVWRDEFEMAFRRAYSPRRRLILDLQRGDLGERAGERDLDFTPLIPDLAAVLEGFPELLGDPPGRGGENETSSPVPAEVNSAHPCDVFRAMEKLTADELSITFVGEKGESGLAASNMLEVRARDVTRRLSLAELDLADRRGGIANHQAAILLAMAEKRYPKRAKQNAQKMTRLRKVLREKFGIKDDPFETYREGSGWVPRFTIVDKRGAADERARRDAERRTVSYDEMTERDESTPGDTAGAYSYQRENDAADKWLEDNDPDA